MNGHSPHVAADESDLDVQIRAFVEALDDVTGPAPRFEDLRRNDAVDGSRLRLAACAGAVAVAGLIGVVVIGHGGSSPESVVTQRATGPAPDGRDPTAVTPTSLTSAPVANRDTASAVTALTAVSAPVSTVSTDAAGAGERLFGTELPTSVSPLIALPGWTVTNAWSDETPVTDGDNAPELILVGDGPRYDAPLLWSTVVTRSASAGNVGLDVSTLGEPVQVGSLTAYVQSEAEDEDTHLAGPVVAMWWDVDESAYVIVNTVRIPIDEAVVLIEQLGDAITTGVPPATVPTGFHVVDVPDRDTHRAFELQFAERDRVLQLSGENGGARSLLAQIGGEVRTTRVVAGVEVAWRPLPNDPGRYWADWQLGDWSFSADGDGFASEEEFVTALGQLEVVDASALAAEDGGADLVTPAERSAVVDDLLAGIPLPPGFDTASLAAAGGANDRYQEIAHVSGAVTCAWLDVYFDAREGGDEATSEQAAAALATASEWPMLDEIDEQGAWAGAVREFADAVNGGPGVGTGNGPVPPTRELAEGGLGCRLD